MQIAGCVHNFEGPKSPQRGGMIQVVPEIEMVFKMCKSQSHHIKMKLGPAHCARHPDSNNVNNTKI